MRLTIPLSTRSPAGALRVVLLGRVASPERASDAIEAQFRRIEMLVRANWSGPIQITKLGEQASGMSVDRPTIKRAQEMIAAGEVDVILSEDLARISRNARHLWDFLQDADDAGVRVICPADAFDTAAAAWGTPTHLAPIRRTDLGVAR